MFAKGWILHLQSARVRTVMIYYKWFTLSSYKNVAGINLEFVYLCLCVSNPVAPNPNYPISLNCLDVTDLHKMITHNKTI